MFTALLNTHAGASPHILLLIKLIPPKILPTICKFNKLPELLCHRWSRSRTIKQHTSLTSLQIKLTASKFRENRTLLAIMTAQ